MSDELAIKASALGSFTFLDKIEKLGIIERYLTWKRELTKVLRIMELWTFIEQPKEPAGAARNSAWTRSHE